MAEILLAIDSYSKLFLGIGILADLLAKAPDEDRLKDLLRRYCLPLLPLVALDALIFSGAIQLSAEAQLAKVLFFLCFFALNWNRLGLNFFIIGMTLNNLAMGVNGGRMPVIYEEGAEELNRLFISESTNLNFLADYIYANGVYMSVGDCCMFIGVLAFALYQTAVMVDSRLINKN